MSDYHMYVSSQVDKNVIFITSDLLEQSFDARLLWVHFNINSNFFSNLFHLNFHTFFIIVICWFGTIMGIIKITLVDSIV